MNLAYEIEKRRAKTGPKPRCSCGKCELCRKREVARRTYYHEAPLNPKRFRLPKAKIPTDPAVLGYIAGLMDGEGCLTRQNGRWRVQIAMTDQPVIEWLGRIGGTVRERRVKGNRKRCWRWLLMRQSEVRLFLVAILPYLMVKHNQAKAVLIELDDELGGIPL